MKDLAAGRLGMRFVRLAEVRGHQVKLFETANG